MSEKYQSRARKEGVGDSGSSGSSRGSSKPHNPIAAGTLGFGRMRQPDIAGQIGGQPSAPKRVAHARRTDYDGVCSHPKGYPGHRVGAKGSGGKDAD